VPNICKTSLEELSGEGDWGYKKRGRTNVGQWEGESFKSDLKGMERSRESNLTLGETVPWGELDNYEGSRSRKRKK